MALPDGTSPRAGASAFVNPLTSPRHGGDDAQRRPNRHRPDRCGVKPRSDARQNSVAKKHVALVNIVRRPEQGQTLRRVKERSTCATHRRRRSWVTSSKPVGATSATIGFDATGGGNLASQILSAMEVCCIKGCPGIQPVRLNHA